jgi:hypothetical protein
MKKIFELTFSDRIVITEIKSELSFSVYEAKKWLKEKYPNIKSIKYLKK